MMDIVIVEAVRSAVGRALKGSLALRRPDDLATDGELRAYQPEPTQSMDRAGRARAGSRARASSHQGRRR